MHTVAPGDTLWSIAAKSNLTTATVAAFNGLSENSNVLLGAAIRIPTVPEGMAALRRAAIAPARADTAARANVAPRAQSGAGPRPQGAYVVRPGDMLSALARQSGVPIAQMGYMNGLRPTAQLLIGTVIRLRQAAQGPFERSSADVSAIYRVDGSSPSACRLCRSSARSSTAANRPGTDATRTGTQAMLSARSPPA